MENKYKVADNWSCANALERFKQFKIDTLEKKIKNGKEYISSGKFKALITVKKKKAENKLAIMEEDIVEMKKIYDAVYILIRRHEHVINELARIYVGMKDSILSKEKFPKELLDEQVKMMDEYYKCLKEILKPCKLEE